MGILIGFGVFAHHEKTRAAQGAESASEGSPGPVETRVVESEKSASADAISPTNAIVASEAPPRTPLLPATPSIRYHLQAPGLSEAALPGGVEQSIVVLTSPSSTFDQRQAEWKRLKETGKLGEVIQRLEQSSAENPQSVEYVAALGQAYLKQCAGMEDLREQALLAMKADKTLEYALSLDPGNWEARYVKAVGMSYWPPQLNKAQEVVDQFRLLIEEQETQPSRPEFARAYLRLGEQYQKAGQPDFAAQVWQRGAAFFPGNPELKARLSSPVGN